MKIRKEFVCDMTKGNEIKLILQFALPMLVGNIFQQLYNMVDSIIVGKYVGKNALAAVGATGSLNFLFISLCIGLASGVGIIIAQYFGAKENDKVKKSIANATYIMVVSGLIMSIVSFVFARSVLRLLGTPDSVIDDSVSYMRIISLGIVVVAIYNAISTVLRALGDSVTPLMFLVVSCIANIVLDLVFVLCFDMGVKGVGIATVMAQVLSAICCLIYALRKNPFFKLKKQHFEVDTKIIKLCIRIGIPVAAQSGFIAISCVALQGVVNGFGETVMSAYTATSRVEQLIHQPFNSLGAALSTFTGQNIGAGELKRVKKGYYKCTLIVGIFSACMFIIMWLFGVSIMKIFITDSDVIGYGVDSLKITSTFYFALGMIYIIRGLLNGASDSFYSMLAGFVEVIGRITFPFILINGLGLHERGIWFTTPLTWIITALFSFARYKQGKWKEKGITRKKVRIPVELDNNKDDADNLVKEY